MISPKPLPKMCIIEKPQISNPQTSTSPKPFPKKCIIKKPQISHSNLHKKLIGTPYSNLPNETLFSPHNLQSRNSKNPSILFATTASKEKREKVEKLDNILLIKVILTPLEN